MIEQEGTCLIFELVVHRALRVHHFVRVARVKGKCISGGVSVLFLAPGFLVFPLLFACLLRDSLSIAILADLGSRACGDFGT